VRFNEEFSSVSEPAILIIAQVILDLNIPGMNGEQTYENLRQIAPQVKVIISSSLSLTEARSRFGERELPTFLQKPYDVDTLLNVIQAEFASVQAGRKLDKFGSLPQSEKDGVSDKRAKAELNRSTVEHEASQQRTAPNPYFAVAQFKEQSMKPEDKSKRQIIRGRRTHKTKEDFLRWLRKKNALKKQAAEEQIRQADPATSRALMVWADDGGQAA
jgi:DNA-binding NarL/FixJ family response regulator